MLIFRGLYREFKKRKKNFRRKIALRKKIAHPDTHLCSANTKNECRMKVNVTVKGYTQVSPAEIAIAYRQSPEWQLYEVVMTSALMGNLYECAPERAVAIRTLVSLCDPVFVAKLAVYVRQNLNLRTVPLILTVELARIHQGDTLVQRAVNQVVVRADEITELLTCYQYANQRMGSKKLNRLSKQIQIGLQNAFNRFDEFQFSRCNNAAEIKLRDALFLVHPKAKDASQQQILNKIVTDELATPDYWESELTSLTQANYSSEIERTEAFRNTWQGLIDNRKVGYIALLRNLRNLLKSSVSEIHVEKVCEFLTAPEAIVRHKQTPFRYLAAWREVSRFTTPEAAMLKVALEKAVLIAAANISGFDESSRVLVACDISGSMQKPVTPKSAVNLFDIGLLTGMMLRPVCKNVITGVFGSEWKTVNFPTTNALLHLDSYYRHEGEVGYATNSHLAIRHLTDREISVDKIMIFSDGHLWDQAGQRSDLAMTWMKYKQLYPKSKLYLFDLAAHGRVTVEPYHREDVTVISGWADRIFDVLAAIDNGGDALLDIKSLRI